MLIKCSRCKCFVEVGNTWIYSECPKCHARTVERFQKKTFKEKLLEDLNPTVSYEQAKREKLLSNLLSEPEPKEPDKPKPIDKAEEFQKQSYIKQRLEREKQQQPQPDQPDT